MRIVLSLISVLFLFFPLPVLSQTSTVTDPGAASNYVPMDQIATRNQQTRYFMRLPGVSPDYRLGSGDVISINVVENRNLNQTLEISNTGNINFLMLGDIHAAGMTAEELEADIAARLESQQLMKNPEVLVYIDSYKSKPFYVVGEVDTPGQFAMSQQLTLMDAIFLGGGLDFSADRYGYLYRKIENDEDIIPLGEQGDPEEMPLYNILMNNPAAQQELLENPGRAEPGTHVLKFDLEPVKRGGIIEPNVPLKEGDVFVVPRSNLESFYVVGDVLRPGSQEIQPGQTLLASRAIAYAGGPSKTARMSKGMLVRYDKDGVRQESKVDFAAILRGKQKDFEVFPGDVIFIPGSNIKTFSYAVLGMIPSGVQRQLPDGEGGGQHR